MQRVLKISLLIVTCWTLSLSCSSKKEFHLIQPDTTSGKVSQFSTVKDTNRRLHFRFDHEGFRYLGQQQVSSSSVENPVSVPKELSGQYLGLALLNGQGQPIYEQIKKNFTSFPSAHHKDYTVFQYKGYFYLDVPLSVDVDAGKTLSVQQIGESTPIAQIEISDISKSYLPPEKSVGWDGKYSVFKVKGDQPAETSYDVVILAEGFDKSEISLQSKDDMLRSKFGRALLSKVLPAFESEPFVSMSTNLNIWVVATASKDSGADLPSEEKFLDTVYDSTFDTFCSRRSLTVKNQERALQLAAKTPFDQVLVMVNSEIYGGQGSDIATFSMNERSTYLIRHELGHAIGLLADEYSYFSDKEAHKTCEDHQIEQYAVHNHKTWGRNRFFEQDQYLAPNLTLFSQPSEAKWAHHLNANSPVVFFDYPLDFNKFQTRDGGRTVDVSSEFKLQKMRSDFFLTLGATPEINSLTASIQRVAINGVEVEFKFVKNGKMNFVQFNAGKAKVDENLKLEFTLNLKEAPSERSLSFLASSQHFVSLPSRTFSGGREIGLFQGANPEMKKVFRSSYNNIMNSGEEFDAVQIEAYIRLMDHFKAEVSSPN